MNQNENKKTGRRTDRREAFSLVFQIPFHKDIKDEKVRIGIAEDYFENFGIENGDKDFILGEFFGVISKLSEIDNIISKHTANWAIDRLSSVDLAILRLAVFELYFADDIPRGVSVSEAVELSKRFGTDESPSFINAILGTIIGYEK